MHTKIIKLIIFILISTCIFSAEKNDSYIKAKILKKISKTDINDSESGLLYTVEYSAKLKSGDEKGKIIHLSNSIYENKIYNTPVKPGSNVVLYKDISENDTAYYIYSLNKLPELLSLFILFIILVVLVSKWSGFKAIIALAVTVILIFKGLIPMVLQGFSPIILSIIFCFISTLITIFLINHTKEKVITSILGTLGGICIAGVLSAIYIKLMEITGYTNMDMVNFSYLLNGIDLKQLVAAGIIIGSLGAVMDVAVSISSSLYEIKKNNKDISTKNLIASGMNIGKDIIGTMVNTLIFAYMGSSLFTILLFLVQKDDFPIIRVFNTEFIIVEILRALCGSFGIIAVVPITAIIGGFILNNKKTNEKDF